MVFGIVDFIFGNVVVVFQNCKIIVKKSMILGQQNIYMVQGRIDLNQVIGFSFQNCVIDGMFDLMVSVVQYKFYLGWLWKVYLVCVIMKLEIKGYVDFMGWLLWNMINFGFYILYFVEYKNFGFGLVIDNRVQWLYQVGNDKQVNYYQVNNFI